MSVSITACWPICIYKLRAENPSANKNYFKKSCYLPKPSAGLNAHLSMLIKDRGGSVPEILNNVAYRLLPNSINEACINYQHAN